MTRVAPPAGDAVLLSWVSVGARAAPLLSALDRPSPLFGKVSKLYLCWRDAPGADDRVIVDETTEALRRALEPYAPEVVRLPWKTEAQPTDHAAIRPFAERALKRVRSENPDLPIYVHLSPGTPAMHAIWLVLGATGLVEGPLTLIQSIPPDKRRAGGAPIEAVSVEVDSWLRRFRAARPRDASTEDDGQLWDPSDFGERSPMRAVLLRLQEWADLRAPVLLLGERGTGKSTLANFLRSIGPFQRRTPQGQAVAEWPAVVCGQFRGDAQMARSELFGHRKGAFTGADRDREGLLEQADGDCLFLDEIADLDRDTQRLLMAALEGRGFHRLGDTKRLHSSFRLICATNRDVADLAGGALDPDFYDRVAVFTLRVPALRECRDDLPVFWRAVVRRVARSSGVCVDGVDELAADPDVIGALRGSSLPGNLRDLQRLAWHLIARLHAGVPCAQAVADATAILVQPRTEAPDRPDVATLRSLLPLAEPLPARLDALRTLWVEAALAEGGGNQSQAARLLGVKRETLKGWLPPQGGA